MAQSEAQVEFLTLACLSYRNDSVRARTEAGAADGDWPVSLWVLVGEGYLRWGDLVNPRWRTREPGYVDPLDLRPDLLEAL